MGMRNQVTGWWFRVCAYSSNHVLQSKEIMKFKSPVMGFKVFDDVDSYNPDSKWVEYFGIYLT